MGDSAAKTVGSPAPAPAAAPPKRLGPFEIEREIGRGAMGIVYQAVHAELRRPCALKVILTVDPTTSERFRREAQAAARLGQHPNVVQVYDAGEADGRTYISMQLIEGKDLADSARARGPLPEAEALEIARKTALALDHAHRNGIVHRDVKPSNVLLDDRGEPHLTDFGLALDVDAARLTTEGDIVGTPHYMAPEQADRRRGEVGPPTDVYALGATLFDILAGDAPYQGSAIGILSQILLDETPRLRARRPDASPAVEAVVAKAMERRPADRYQTALELADDLGRVLAGDPPRARPQDGIGPAVRRFVRRHRHAARGGILVAAVAAVVALGLGGSALRTRLRREAAVRRSVEAVIASDPDVRLRALEEAIALDPEWPVLRVQLIDASYARAVRYYRAGDFAAYERDLRIGLRAIEEAPAAGRLVAGTRHLRGSLYEWLGEPERAIAAYEAHAAADPDGFWGLDGAASAALLRGDFAAAEAAASRAIAIDPAEGSGFLLRSVARLECGDLDGALADATGAIDVYPGDDWRIGQRARVRLARGELRLAAEDLVFGLRTFEASPVLYAALAALARREGEPERAAALARRAAALAGGRPPPYLECEKAPWAKAAAEPGPAVARVRAAEARLAAGDPAGAAAEATAALGLSPAGGAAFRVRAEAFRRLGWAGDAAEDARWAALLDPDHAVDRTETNGRRE